ncbi:MAG: DNA polymerase III subunit beta [Oscillospiraceae bacterium]|nr:DNA polymerase III subunit beta [Oscillospiraceae bacterium]
MKFSCDKAPLLSSILTVSRAVSSRSSIAALEGILIVADTKLILYGYNMEIGIREELEADIEVPGSVVIVSRLLTDIIRRLPDDKVVFSLSDKMVMHIECGRSIYDISACYDGQAFPNMPSVPEEECALMTKRMLKEMIQGTVFAVSENDAKKIHMGSKFVWENGCLSVVSIDGFRLAMRRQAYTGTAPQEDFVVPGAALREVEKLLSDGEENIRIVLGSRHIMFQIDTITLTTRLLEGEFINYMATIPKEQPVSVTLNTQEFASCIERVSLLINEKIKNPLRLYLEENRIVVSCTTALGAAQDDCPATVVGLPEDNPEMEIGFNHRYLLEALNSLKEQQCVIRFTNPLSPCIIVPQEGDAFMHMILPVRLRSE